MSNMKELNKISKELYSVSYDSLNDYLRGIRDLLNIINGSENPKSITKYIIKEVKYVKRNIIQGLY